MNLKEKINLQLFASPTDIILGDGVFDIAGTDIAVTRGGGVFTVEREFRMIEADGDYGPVKGRVRLIKEVPKLTVRMLEILPANIPKMYPATSEDTTTTPGTSIITGIDGTITDVQTGDYQTTIGWTGATKAGKAVTIEISNAINMDNINWDLIDKEEVVPEIVWTGCYDESTRTTSPWSISIVTA